ncbi:MAG TPA: hypothetical protein VGG54_12030, partial [Trebonia sp.]
MISCPARPVAVAARTRAATRAPVITVTALARAAVVALAVAARPPAVTAAPAVVRLVGWTSGRAARAAAAATRARA